MPSIYSPTPPSQDIYHIACRKVINPLTPKGFSENRLRETLRREELRIGHQIHNGPTSIFGS